MSASERLREFDALPRGTASDVAVAFALRNALPKIVAVLEAAESIESVFDDDRLTHFLVMTERGVELRDALAALEEKLTP